MDAITYGWEKNADAEGSFWVKFAPCSREPRSWKEEVYEAARSIVNSTEKPIYLCFSGGIDSEIMCRAFFDQGIHFRVITVEHAGGTNEHDIRYAKKWCRDHDVEQHILRLDMTQFLQKEVPAYAEKGYVTGNVFRYFQIKLFEEAERLGGYAVLGGGEQLYHVDEKKDGTLSDPYLQFETGYSVPFEWCKKNGTVHEPYFYFRTPEVALSYLRIAIVNYAMHDPEVFRHPRNSFMFKRLVYQMLWPDLEPRNKYSGYENILPLRVQAQKDLVQKFGTRIQLYRLPVETLSEQLSPSAA